MSAVFCTSAAPAWAVFSPSFLFAHLELCWELFPLPQEPAQVGGIILAWLGLKPALSPNLLLPPAMHPIPALIPVGFLCPVRVGLILIFINRYSGPTEMLLPAAYFSLQGTVYKGWEIPADLGQFCCW